jgi:hypothetical protein
MIQCYASVSELFSKPMAEKNCGSRRAAVPGMWPRHEASLDKVEAGAQRSIEGTGLLLIRAMKPKAPK